MVKIKKGEEEMDQDKTRTTVFILSERNQIVDLVSPKLLMSNVMH